MGNAPVHGQKQKLGSCSQVFVLFCWFFTKDQLEIVVTQLNWLMHYNSSQYALYGFYLFRNQTSNKWTIEGLIKSIQLANGQ